MSVADRLNELHAITSSTVRDKPDVSTAEWFGSMVRAADLLPEIAAVIAAAETLVETVEGNVYLEAIGAIDIGQAVPEIVTDKTLLRDSLAALAARLDGTT